MTVSGSTLDVGDEAPDFELEDQHGRRIRLSDFRGKRRVVLYFYPRDDTPGCTKEACGFRDVQPQLEERNAVVLGVSADTVESHRRFAEKYGLRFHLLSDPDKTVIKQYGVYKEKTMYGRQYWGVERTTFIIDENGKIVGVYRAVRVDGHSQQVLGSLQHIHTEA
jgi:peroxiredoxin Q/BCP